MASLNLFAEEPFYPGLFPRSFLLGAIFPWPGGLVPGLFANKYLYNYNDDMKYLKPYTLFESGPSAERLVSLGLYDGPVIRWELTANPSSWIESSNPVIGRFLVDEIEGGESIGMGNYWTLYLSSFRDSYSDLVEWHLNQLFKLGPSQDWQRSHIWLSLKETVQAQLGWAVLKYKPETWSDGDPVAAQCLNDMEWSWCKKPVKPLL